MLSVVIQAGGGSVRMGRDKALMPFLGRPLIQRIVDRLSPVADEMLVTTNRPGSYEFLGLPLFPDLIPGRGALGGLYTALSSASQPLVAVVACDMPFANSEILKYASKLIRTSGADAAIPSTSNGLEPFHAVYRRQTCLPAIEAAIEAGEWRAIAWFPQVDLRIIPPSDIAHLDPDELTFRNLNTPDEFSQAEYLARLQEFE